MGQIPNPDEGLQQKTNDSLEEPKISNRWIPMDVGRKQTDIATWAQDPDFRFDDIYNFITYKDWLHRAYLSVKTNAGANTAGIDGETAEDFADNLDENLKDISQQLDSESYDPDPTRRVYIPKGNGEKRPLSIPTVRDRIVQESLRMLLEPVYESDFSQYSFSFRPGRSTHDAIKIVRSCFSRTAGYMPWIIDADISGFFDNLSHMILEQTLQDRITQEKVRNLIWKFLKAGVMDGDRMMKSVAGTPQGGILSPLLANVYLDKLDQWVKQWTDLSHQAGKRRRRSGKGNWTYVRYADDFLLLTNGTRKKAETVKGRVEGYIEDELKLSLNEEKTGLLHAEDEGVNFLGYHLEARHPGDGGGGVSEIPQEAVQDVKQSIRRRTEGDTDLSARRRFRGLNYVLRGWANYFKYATRTSQVFGKVQHFAWKRLTCWLAEKYRCSVGHLCANVLDGLSPISINGVQMVDIRTMGTEYRESPLQRDHPYLDERVTRSEPTSLNQFFEDEYMPGHEDLKWKALEREGWTCQECGKDLGWETAELHHLEYSGKLEDAESLCVPCHKKKDPGR